MMEAKQKNPGSAIERTAREQPKTRLSAPAIKCRSSDRAHSTQTHVSLVALAAIANSLRRGDSRAVMSDQLHCLQSSAKPVIERTYVTGSSLKSSINMTFIFSCKLTLRIRWRRSQRPKTSMFFVVNTPKRLLFIYCFYFLLIVSPFSIGG